MLGNFPAELPEAFLCLWKTFGKLLSKKTSEKSIGKLFGKTTENFQEKLKKGHEKIFEK